MKRFASVYYMATVLGAMTLIGLGWPARAAHARTASSSVASGCVLDSASASRATTSAVFGSVTFKGTSTGLIRLTCPVSVPVRSTYSNYLAVNYYDPDGAGTTCQVRAFLLRTNLNELERGNTIVGFDSNNNWYSWTEAATGRSMGYVYIPESLNSDTSYYWVDLELVRAGTSCNPTAVGAYLITP